MKNCENCGTQFQEKTDRAKYCSKSCNVIASRKRSSKTLNKAKIVLNKVTDYKFDILIHLKPKTLNLAVILAFILLFTGSIPNIRRKWQESSLKSQYEQFNTDTTTARLKLQEEKKLHRIVREEFKIIHKELNTILLKHPRLRAKLVNEIKKLDNPKRNK